VDSKLEDTLQDEQEAIRKLFTRPQETLHGFLVELREVVETKLARQEADGEDSPAVIAPKLQRTEYYEHLLRELEEIGWSHVEFMDEALRELALSVLDQAGRKHVLRVRLDERYPKKIGWYRADLPKALRSSSSPVSPLQSLLHGLKETAESFAELFDALDDLDAEAWVLEPEKPTRSDTFRKIVVGRHATLLIDLDPFKPTAFPDCRFVGSEAAIGPLRSRLDAGISRWDMSKKPRHNLEELLDLKLPQRERDDDGGGSKEFTLECGICYAFRLDGVGIPDTACEFEPCSRPYHRSCLFEWLRSVPDSRQSFDTLFGQCPYCSKPISVRG